MNQILAELRERFPDEPALKLAILDHDRRRLRRSGQSLCGPYYWVPAQRRWKLLSFFENPDDYIGHVDIWREVVETLAIEWRREPKAAWAALQNHEYGLPRGRVVKNGAVYTVFHGDDHPIRAKEAVATIGIEYRLPRCVMAERDAHERMLPGDPEAVQRFLKTHLGIAAPSFEELDKAIWNKARLQLKQRKGSTR